LFGDKFHIIVKSDTQTQIIANELHVAPRVLQFWCACKTSN